ncbi:hypothetical protein M758_6G016100 [Ceratodon purpureus]|uniref:Uncharacterized protein n=1 Tax=Ceratodon purpureus TaxID=3225 RepID=A0A8T0H948_CERPU|nr:hypothetical protein KC19_6G018500 [Ceratodon purpureus]KAG0612293.1 hypothetical protein M758_6G016100 [Ceratodon purpureus]
MSEAALGNLDFDDMLRYVESGQKPGTLKFLSPRKPELQNSIAPVAHNLSVQGGVKRTEMQPKSQKRQSKKGRTTYESDDDAQIAMRLARLRRDVLEQQDDVEEEVVNEHDHTDDALERLRSFRESLGIPEPQQRLHSTPKSKAMSKRRYSASDRHLGRRDFESPAEVSEAQLLARLQKLRQSLTSPERSKTSKSQRASKKKRIQYFPSNSAERQPTNMSMSAELFSAVAENPQPQDASMLHLQGVNPGLANNQQWSMDLNNVMHMGFSMEGAQVDQYVAAACGHGHLHQYTQ